MKRILVIEPYFSGSHQAWAEGYRAHSGNQVDLLTMPGRFWKWRMFGGTLTLAKDAVRFVDDDRRPDLILASDMVDLPGFLGHAGPEIANVATVLYMHENQLTYPLSPTAREDLAYAYMNWSSMVRADEVWFNSSFHLESVFDALPAFLRHFPDHRHLEHLDDVREKSRVVPVGVEFDWVTPAPKADPPLIIWNQRWEYDKDPVRLFEASDRLAKSGADFRLALCGENFRNVPVEFEEAKERLGERIIQYGYADRPLYEQLLLEASVVVSTAQHEFFGVGVVEAIAAGAVPILPRALSYPELIPGSLHDEVLYDSDMELDQMLARAVSEGEWRSKATAATTEHVSKFSWTELGPEYDRRVDDLFARLAAR